MWFCVKFFKEPPRKFFSESWKILDGWLLIAKPEDEKKNKSCTLTVPLRRAMLCCVRCVVVVVAPYFFLWRRAAAMLPIFTIVTAAAAHGCREKRISASSRRNVFAHKNEKKKKKIEKKHTKCTNQKRGETCEVIDCGSLFLGTHWCVERARVVQIFHFRNCAPPAVAHMNSSVGIARE